MERMQHARKRDSSVEEYGDVQVPRAQARLSLMVIYDESRERERVRDKERGREKERERAYSALQ